MAEWTKREIKKLRENPNEYFWDDLRFTFTTQQRGFIITDFKPDFDETNVGLLFPRNDDSEIVYIIAQFPHDWAHTNIKPHLHWQQMNSNTIVWKMDYKWFDNNSAVPAGFTTLSVSGGTFSYTSGNLAQISSFDEIDATDIKGSSSIMLIKIYRDDDVAGGTGTGSNDVLAWEFDIHYQRKRPQDGLGTYFEFQNLTPYYQNLYGVDKEDA